MKNLFSPYNKDIQPSKLVVEMRDLFEATSQLRWPNWLERLDESIEEEEVYGSGSGCCAMYDWATAKRPNYDHRNKVDLLRFIRNVSEHHHDEKNWRDVFKSRIDVWHFFNSVFLELFCLLYRSVKDNLPKERDYDEFPRDA